MRIEELHIETSDPVATKVFYGDILGLKPERDSPSMVSFRLPQSLLAFHASEKKPHYHFAFNIPHNKVHEAAAWLSAKTSLIPIQDQQLIADFRSWNAEAVYFFDNNGNILEFIGRRDLPNQSGLPFNSSSILSICEFGIVTKNVSGTCTSLIEQYGLDYFAKQPPLHDFAALGDDEGLLIVVSDNRNWYPTKIPSSMHGYRLLATQGEKEFMLETNF